MINKEEFVKNIRKDLRIELYEEKEQDFGDFSKLDKITEDIFRKTNNESEN